MDHSKRRIAFKFWACIAVCSRVRLLAACACCSDLQRGGNINRDWKRPRPPGHQFSCFGVPHVVCSPTSLSDSSARLFVGAFYGALEGTQGMCVASQACPGFPASMKVCICRAAGALFTGRPVLAAFNTACFVVRSHPAGAGAGAGLPSATWRGLDSGSHKPKTLIVLQTTWQALRSYHAGFQLLPRDGDHSTAPAELPSLCWRFMSTEKHFSDRSSS